MYRPAYPRELYDFILSYIENKQNTWDCGTGNWQAAKELTKTFEKVYATESSQIQIRNAVPKDNIIYAVQPAEKTNFSDSSFDPVTAARPWIGFGLTNFILK